MKILVLTILTLLFISCNKESSPDCIKSTGIDSEIIRLLDDFNVIDISHKFDITISPDTSNFLVLTGGLNLLGKISTVVDGNELLISNDNNCNFVRSLKRRIKIDIHTSGFRQLKIRGASNLNFSDTLNVPVFHLDCFKTNNQQNLLLKTDSTFIKFHVGSNECNLLGSSNYLYLFNLGHSWFYGEQFLSKKTAVTSKSSGDCFVHSSEKLVVEIFDSGDVFYEGQSNNILIKEQSGSGTLSPL